MQSDEHEHTGGDFSDQDEREKTLQWLLEQDFAEPKDTLFELSQNTELSDELTDLEAALAGRPMFSHNASADDLSAYVEEEIVLGDVGGASDIYSGDSRSVTEEAAPDPLADSEPLMAIDHRRIDRDRNPALADVADGTDILGLPEDDDIGARPMALQRGKADQTEPPAAGSDAGFGAPGETAAVPAAPREDAPEDIPDRDLAVDPVAAERPPEDAWLSAEYPAGEAQAAGSAGDLESYVVNNPAPADEEAFDRYLLAGADLPLADASIDSFDVELTEGIPSVDASLDDTLDYHEDFALPAGLSPEILAALSAAEQANRDAGELEAPAVSLLSEPSGEEGAAAEFPYTGQAANESPGAGHAGQQDVGPYEERIRAGNEESVFDLDLFAGADDLDDWVVNGEPGDDADLDALLESLGPGELPVDEQILALDEAALAAGEPDPAPPRDTASQAAGSADDGQGSGHWCIPDFIRFNRASGSSQELVREFLEAFLEEGAVELEKLEDAIGEWEQDPGSRAGSDVVPRVLHTLKGIAKGVGLQRYGTLVHNFETLLQGLPGPESGEEAPYFRIVNAWLDATLHGFEEIQRTGNDVASELPQVTAAEGQVDETTPTRPAPGTGVPDALEQHRDKQIADEGVKALAAQQTIRMSSASLDHLLNLSNQAQQLGVRTSQATFRGKRAAIELQARLSSLRSHISKIADRALLSVTARGARSTGELDALEMDQYSDLQEAANILREGIEDLDDLIRISSRQSTSAEALLKQQASVITELGSSLRDARVVPVARLMPGLRRLVRNVGAELGKSVNFKVLNEVGNLDRDSHVCCQIVLEHMVRNALDHGIEAPDERRAAGKSEQGEIAIDVWKDGSDYLLRLQDDGRGMKPEDLREAALARGMGLNVAELDDREALRLILHKGFSTATHVSEVSGRGVGMDVVISELQQIGGEIDIESEPGRGTTFQVRVPSNVNVNGALLVSAAETQYAIPYDGLVATERVDVDDFYEAIEQGCRLTIYGIECEPAYLATLCSGERLPERSAWTSNSMPVIIAGDQGRHMAIAVDDVTEALELVIRSLGSQFTGIPGLVGGATTSDGRAIVALDLNGLVRSIADSGRSAVALERKEEERLLVLVVDDSRTQRMVATNQFDALGVETVTAENGLVAIDLLNTIHRLPDVVLLDVEMPVKDGIQTLREIRRSSRYGHLPVIMVTSRTGPKHRALAREAGCNAYLGKPFNFPLLVAQIAQLTGYPLSAE